MRTIALLIAALATSLVAAGAGAQELGRLFFTPEQRAALDARRKARVPDKPAATPQAESPITRINGAVQRSGGKSTVWVNGEAIPEGAPCERAAPAPSARDPAGFAAPAKARSATTCASANHWTAAAARCAT
jgi:hypothetical protein